MSSLVNSLRKVISTRAPGFTSSGATSVSSIGRRPPPSKSTMAKITGGLSEYTRWSIVNVTIVPGTSAIGTGALPLGNGGICGAPESGSARPTKPYFQSPDRPAADDDGRGGSGRRGGAAGGHPPPDRELAGAPGGPAPARPPRRAG